MSEDIDKLISEMKGEVFEEIEKAKEKIGDNLTKLENKFKEVKNGTDE